MEVPWSVDLIEPPKTSATSSAGTRQRNSPRPAAGDYFLHCRTRPDARSFLMTGPTNMWSTSDAASSICRPARRRFSAVTPESWCQSRGARSPPRTNSQTPRRDALRFHGARRFVEATCPWGNRIRCYAPDERFGRITLGIAYVDSTCRKVPPTGSRGSTAT